MCPDPHKSIEVFYSYAHEDEKLRDELKKHLSNLKRQGVITDWYDRDISAGREWDDEIKQHLNSAKVILLLISPDFMDSDYINDVEVERTMERHESGDARVIPVILRPVDWEGAPFSKLQALPTDALPVTSWENRDEAFLSVAKAIRKALGDPAKGSKTAVSARANIPRPPVVGFVARRDSEDRDIVERLKEELAPQKNQLVALSGPGGVGKTTLAVEATRALGESFGHHIVWTSALGREFAFSTLLDEVATQLGRADLRPLAPEAKAEQVAAVIASAPSLIILDNFETMKLAEQTLCVAFLLNRAMCPALITTRQRIASARNITIPVMSPEEADDFIKRLIEQAGDSSAFEQLDRKRIMEASDRNPLVMQWIMGQIDLAQDANTILDDLAQGIGDAAQRVFDRSFGLEQLGDDGRAILLALSLFAPDASRPALAEVAGFGGDLRRANEAVRRLASLYLVKTASGGQRLTVAGLTRELARARLSKDESAMEFCGRFVGYFVEYAKAHAQPTPEDYEALEEEKNNLLGAMDVAFQLKDWNPVKSIGAVLPVGMLNVHGYWDEAIHRGQQALEAAGNSNHEYHVGAFANNLGALFAQRGDYSVAKEYYEKAAEIARRLDAKQGLAATLDQLGRLAQDQGEVDEARRFYNESLQICEQLKSQSGIAHTLSGLGRLAQDQGELEDARRLYDKSLEIKKELGDQRGIANTLHQLAILAQDKGELEEARLLYSQSLEINEKFTDQNGIGATLHQLAMLAQVKGEIEQARRLYRQSLEIQKKLGDQRGVSRVFHQLAIMAQEQGQLEEARRLYDQSLEIAMKLGDQSGIAKTLGQLAILAHQAGELEEARQLYNQSLEIAKKLGDQSVIAITLHQLAMLAQDQGNLEEARLLYNHSLEITKKLGYQSEIAITLYQLGVLSAKSGNPDEAGQMFREALAILEKLGSPKADIARESLARVLGTSS